MRPSLLVPPAISRAPSETKSRVTAAFELLIRGLSRYGRLRSPDPGQFTTNEGVVHRMLGVLGGHEHGGDGGDVELARREEWGCRRGHLDDLLAEHSGVGPLRGVSRISGRAGPARRRRRWAWRVGSFTSQASP